MSSNAKKRSFYCVTSSSSKSFKHCALWLRAIYTERYRKNWLVPLFSIRIENGNNTSQINIRLRPVYCLSRWLTCCSYVDYDTVAGADKFGNVFVVSISRTWFSSSLLSLFWSCSSSPSSFIFFESIFVKSHPKTWNSHTYLLKKICCGCNSVKIRRRVFVRELILSVVRNLVEKSTCWICLILSPLYRHPLDTGSVLLWP